MTINATDKIIEALRQRAHDESRPFCYSDYITVTPNEDGEAFCPRCGSDDLMREVEGVGVEYGYEWVMEHIVKEDGERVDIEELHRDMLDEIYPSVKFGKLEYSASHVFETVDPIAFNMGANEYAYSLAEDGQLIEIDGDGYYRLDGITV